MKMLTTQLNGLLQRIASSQEEAIEDTARLLAQAAVGEGRVILHGTHDSTGVVMHALDGAEPFANAVPLTEGVPLGSMDRVWLFARDASSEETLELARSLAESDVPFAVVSNAKVSEDNALAELADVYIATGITKGLLPDDDGGRVVQPHLLAALFIYEAVKLSYDEMLMDV